MKTLKKVIKFLLTRKLTTDSKKGVFDNFGRLWQLFLTKLRFSPEQPFWRTNSFRVERFQRFDLLNLLETFLQSCI